MPAERDGFWFDAPDASLALKRSGNHVSLAQAVPPWMVVDQALDGDDAFVLIDDNGETEQVLAPMWRDASDACLYAAMALGGARWVTDDEAAVLTQAWRSVFHGSVDAPPQAASPPN